MGRKAAAMYRLQQGAITLVDAHLAKHSHSVPEDFLPEHAELLYNAMLYLPDNLRNKPQTRGLAEQLILYFSQRLYAKRPVVGIDSALIEDFIPGMHAYDVAALSITKPKIVRLSVLYGIDAKQLELIMNKRGN
ncbi:MAG: hypothetical protein AABX75_00525 [Nanoarchaeota archaeon]